MALRRVFVVESFVPCSMVMVEGKPAHVVAWNPKGSPSFPWATRQVNSNGRAKEYSAWSAKGAT